MSDSEWKDEAYTQQDKSNAIYTIGGRRVLVAKPPPHSSLCDCSQCRITVLVRRMDTLDDRLAKEFKSIKDRLNELEEGVD